MGADDCERLHVLDVEPSPDGVAFDAPTLLAL
jgi:hypothetical protein